MTDYVWPAALIPSASEWRLVANTAAFASPLSGTTRTLGRGGDRWACSLQFNALTGEKRARLQAFLARLRGQTHRAVLPDHAYRKRGALTANFLVNGGSQAGTSLVCDGAAVSVTNALREGDWITVAGYLYMVVADVNTSAGGALTLTITPPLRGSPADNAPVVIDVPTARMMLADQTVGWSNVPGTRTSALSSMSLDFVEDLL
jgi:hypothetical protein